LPPHLCFFKVPTFSYAHSFQKQRKMPSEPLILRSARVVYSTNLQKATFTFGCSNGGGNSVDDMGGYQHGMFVFGNEEFF
jgi:hypothetical protein